MIDLFFKGGILMFPLLLGSFIVLTIIIERTIVFSHTGLPLSFINELKTGIIGSGNNTLLSFNGNNPIQNLFLEILRKKAESRESIEKHISIQGELILHNLDKHLHLLELIGRMAPMMGLLGTVMGMVDAFRQVAAVETVVDPSILASGIWEALITTVFGLIVGIPSLIAHHLFTSRIERIAFLMKHHGEGIITLVKDSYD